MQRQITALAICSFDINARPLLASASEVDSISQTSFVYSSSSNSSNSINTNLPDTNKTNFQHFQGFLTDEVFTLKAEYQNLYCKEVHKKPLGSVTSKGDIKKRKFNSRNVSPSSDSSSISNKYDTKSRDKHALPPKQQLELQQEEPEQQQQTSSSNTVLSASLLLSPYYV